MDGNIERTKSSLANDTVEPFHELLVRQGWAIIESVTFSHWG